MSKKPFKKSFEPQKTVGSYASGGGQLLLASVFVACLVDVFVLNSASGFSIPLHYYLTGIFAGVALQFVGAAIANMRFSADTVPAAEKSR